MEGEGSSPLEDVLYIHKREQVDFYCLIEPLNVHYTDFYQQGRVFFI